ncbi:MAG: domain containing protein [Chitinophagaceae bacterium]|nr:domain containing protein [Chitinophagaceae bacterium]
MKLLYLPVYLRGQRQKMLAQVGFLIALFFLMQESIAQVAYTCGTDSYKACGPNLAVNGDFADMTCPPTTFTSELAVQCAPNPAVFTQTLGPGHFHITTKAQLWNGPWSATDHTGNGSGILIGDASNAGDRVIWSQDIVVTAGNTYYFSSYGTNIAGSAFPGPGLTFSINGTQFFKNVIPDRNWQHICTIWTAPISGAITIKIILDSGEYGGHDVGIDDILFQTVCPINECKVTIDQPALICQNKSDTLHASGGLTYAWSPATGLSDSSIADPIVSPLQTTIYTVIMTDEFGCKDTSSVQVIVDPNCCEGNFVPNLITPNGDGLNDTFNIGCIKDIPWVFRVYNRWGALVYSNENYQNQWGANGLSDGVYYFQLEQKNGLTYKGWVQVVR